MKIYTEAANSFATRKCIFRVKDISLFRNGDDAEFVEAVEEHDGQPCTVTGVCVDACTGKPEDNYYDIAFEDGLKLSGISGLHLDGVSVINESVNHKVDKPYSSTFEYDGVKFRILFHSVSSGNRVELIEYHPYDNARYYWAYSTNGGRTFSIQREGERTEATHSMKTFAMEDLTGEGVELPTFNWTEIAQVLRDFNKNIAANIDHN